MLEITFLGAAFAGLLSFLSPCILPIVPFYLSYLAGVGMNQITADGPVDAAVRRRAANRSKSTPAQIYDFPVLSTVHLKPHHLFSSH